MNISLSIYRRAGTYMCFRAQHIYTPFLYTYVLVLAWQARYPGSKFAQTIAEQGFHRFGNPICYQGPAIRCQETRHYCQGNAICLTNALCSWRRSPANEVSVRAAEGVRQ